MALLASVGYVQLLNCTRGQATTISALQDFAWHNENLILLLQEPWIDRHGNRPSLSGFDTFTPSPRKPRCATYVRHTPGLTATHLYSHPLVPRHYNYHSPRSRIHARKFLLPSTCRAAGSNPSDHPPTGQLHIDGRSQCTPPVVAGTPPADSLCLTRMSGNCRLARRQQFPP